MLTVYGEGRGFRVIWLLEELGLAYRLRPVDLPTVKSDRDFLAINPAATKAWAARSPGLSARGTFDLRVSQ